VDSNERMGTPNVNNAVNATSQALDQLYNRVLERAQTENGNQPMSPEAIQQRWHAFTDK